MYIKHRIEGLSPEDFYDYSTKVLLIHGRQLKTLIPYNKWVTGENTGYQTNEFMVVQKPYDYRYKIVDDYELSLCYNQFFNEGLLVLSNNLYKPNINEM